MTTAQRDSHDLDVSAAELEERLRLLQGVSIFFPLPDRELRRLTRKARHRRVPRGTEIVKQGEIDDRLHVIARGRCEVKATWSAHHSVTVAVLSTGEFFGVSAMKGGTAQPASVIAVEPVELLELLATDIDEVIGEGSPAREEMERLVEQRRATVDELTGHAAVMASGQDAHIIAVYSPKGGAGKTTIAVNLAATLAQKHRGECLLLDLGLPYNHAALIANLVPTSSLAAQDAAADHELEELLLSACIHHPVGMMVLSGALRVEQSELVTPELVQRALAALRRNFNYIVIDMGVSMSETALGVIERAGNVLLVLTPELTSMKDGKELIEIFQSVLSIPSGNIKVVLNHPRAGSLVTRSLVEATLGHAVDFELDHDGDRCDRAAVTGNLLIMSAPASPLAKRLKAMAGSLEAAVGAGSAQSEHHAKVAR